MITSGDIKRYIAGQITANGTTEVELKVPVLEADSVVLISCNTVAGTPAAVYVSTKNVTTKTLGFKSAASNTSVYDIIVFA